MDQSFGEVYKLYLVSHSVRGHIHQLTTEFIISSHPYFKSFFIPTNFLHWWPWLVYQQTVIEKIRCDWKSIIIFSILCKYLLMYQVSAGSKASNQLSMMQEIKRHSKTRKMHLRRLHTCLTSMLFCTRCRWCHCQIFFTTFASWELFITNIARHKSFIKFFFYQALIKVKIMKHILLHFYSPIEIQTKQNACWYNSLYIFIPE